MDVPRLIALAKKTVLVSVFCCDFLCPPSFAQNSLSKIDPPDCTAADVDPALRISESHSYQTAEVALRNISGHACYLHGALARNFMTAKPGLPIEWNRVEECYNCTPDGKSHFHDPLLLENGKVAHQTFGWTSAFVFGGQPCIQPNILEFILSLHKVLFLETKNPILSVCSQVDVNAFSLGPDLDASKGNGPAKPGAIASMKVMADRDTYYVGQRIRLALDVETPESVASPIESECPLLFERVRSPDGLARFDQIGAAWDFDCKVKTSTNLGSKRIVTLDLNSGHNNRWGGVGEHTIEFVDASCTTRNEWIPSATSNTLHLRIGDPSTIKRTWGNQVEGLAANVTMDQDSYEVGKDVAIHAAVENFAASVPIYGASPVWDPCGVMDIEVLDSTGQPVPQTGAHICTSGGPSGAFRFAKGMIVPQEWSLQQLGLLPDRPGVYTVVATWQPFQGTDDTCGLCPLPENMANVKRFVVRSNVAKFSIRGKQD